MFIVNFAMLILSIDALYHYISPYEGGLIIDHDFDVPVTKGLTCIHVIDTIKRLKELFQV